MLVVFGRRNDNVRYAYRLNLFYKLDVNNYIALMTNYVGYSHTNS